MTDDPKYKVYRDDKWIYLATESDLIRFHLRPTDVLYAQAVFGWMWIPSQRDHARMPQLSDWQ